MPSRNIYMYMYIYIERDSIPSAHTVYIGELFKPSASSVSSVWLYKYFMNLYRLYIEDFCILYIYGFSLQTLSKSTQ